MQKSLQEILDVYSKDVFPLMMDRCETLDVLVLIVSIVLEVQSGVTGLGHVLASTDHFSISPKLKPRFKNVAEVAKTFGGFSVYVETLGEFRY